MVVEQRAGLDPVQTELTEGERRGLAQGGGGKAASLGPRRHPVADGARLQGTAHHLAQGDLADQLTGVLDDRQGHRRADGALGLQRPEPGPLSCFGEPLLVPHGRHRRHRDPVLRQERSEVRGVVEGEGTGGGHAVTLAPGSTDPGYGPPSTPGPVKGAVVSVDN